MHPDTAGELRSYADRLEAPALIPGSELRGVLAADRLTHALDQAHRQRNKQGAQDGEQALGGSGIGATDSNSILDHGAPGLRYFEYFAPPYHRCVSGSDIGRDKAGQIYDEQRDMNFAALREDAGALTAAATTLASEIIDQRNSWDAIEAIWTGRGAAAANTYVDGYFGQAQTAQSQVQQFGSLLTPAADALEKAVHDKAQLVAGLYADTIGGKTPEQIDEIITYAQTRHNALTGIPESVRILQMFGASVSPGRTDRLLMTVGALVPGGFPLGSESYANDLLHQAQEFATNFVERVFKPDVEGRWRALLDACAATDTSVREIYQQIVDDANTMNDHPFTTPPGALPLPSGHPVPPGGSGASSLPVAGRSAPDEIGVPTPPGVNGQPEPPVDVPPPHAPPGAAGPETPASAGTGSGVAWLRDPAQPPPGVAIDPPTGEVMPPASTTPATATATATAGSATAVEPAPGGGPATSVGPAAGGVAVLADPTRGRRVTTE